VTPQGSAQGKKRSTRIAAKLATGLFAAFLLLAALEGALSILLAWRDAATEVGISEETTCDYDPLLGWVAKKDFRAEDLYGEGRSLTTNARGFRGSVDYAEEVPAGRYRIVCCGDSFTLGYGVDDASTYASWLERLAPDIEAVNMGQGGYGTDQAYLWYERDGVALDADLVLFVAIAPDWERMLDDRFQGEYPKPVLRLEGARLLKPSEPLAEDWTSASGSRAFGAFVENLAVRDFFARLARRSPPSVALDAELPFRDLGAALLAALAELCRSRGQALAVVQLPLQDRRAGNPEAVARWLAETCAELDAPFLDLGADLDELLEDERNSLYLSDGHLDPLGNRFVAERLLLRLATLVEGFPQ
jgi:hypothetical protein